jgi:hypothetical protein
VNGDTGQWLLSGRLDDGPIFRGIEDGPMAGANEQLLARVVINRATSVRAGGIVGHELAVAEMDEDTGVAVRRNSKSDRAVGGDRTHLSDGISSRCPSCCRWRAARCCGPSTLQAAIIPVQVRGPLASYQETLMGETKLRPSLR